MVKDEDVCLHCGLCAERCPTGAWDMSKFLLDVTQAGPACRAALRTQMSLSHRFIFPPPGLDPGIHGLAFAVPEPLEDVDDRVRPGPGKP